MTLKFFSRGVVLALFVVTACGHQHKTTYTYRQPGYYYQLLAFNSDSASYHHHQVAWLNASFATQHDSVFWDSYNNLSDRFFVHIDSLATGNFLRHAVSLSAAQDSVCLLIKPKDFFLQQFGFDSIPFFSRNDTVVKVNYRVKQVFDQNAFAQISHNMRQEEQKQIEAFFGSPGAMELAQDPLGFYWLDQPLPSTQPAIEEGDMVIMSYKGYFLNGRLLESSRENFEYVYGTPDQLLKGVNYVSGRLKLGQTAKILLSSRLAFGESGSSNGNVPPFTPLVYELKIIDVKKIK